MLPPERRIPNLEAMIDEKLYFVLHAPRQLGKTTAMRMITGFLEPDQGSIRVAGHDLESQSLEARRKIGYLSEMAPAYGEMTVTGFLEFIAETREIEDVESAIGRVVRLAGLEKVVHQTIETLSKGFQRRVGLAQALIHDPEVLILDEPRQLDLHFNAAYYTGLDTLPDIGSRTSKSQRSAALRVSPFSSRPMTRSRRSGNSPRSSASMPNSCTTPLSSCSRPPRAPRHRRWGAHRRGSYCYGR